MPPILLHEHPTEQPNGIRRLFTTSHPYIKGTVYLWINGQLKHAPYSDGFVELGSKKVLINSAPLPEDIITIQYRPVV